MGLILFLQFVIFAGVCALSGRLEKLEEHIRQIRAIGFPQTTDDNHD